MLEKIESPRRIRLSSVGVEERDAVRKPRLQRELQVLAGNAELGVAGEVARDDLVAVDRRAGAPVRIRPSVFAPPLTTRSPPIRRAPRPVRHGSRRYRRAVGQAEVDPDRAALLREARHLDHARALAVDLRGLRQHRADGHHAGAADPGDDHVVGAVDRGSAGRAGRHVELSRRLLADRRALDRHEAGQKPLRQEKSLLQDDWSMARLRPSSVSSGTMETQFDCTPQSPQPSQTSVLMKTAGRDRGICRACGGGAFRRRRSGRR
jgi:hypothetical protein